MPEAPARAPEIASRLATLILVLAGVFALYLVGSTVDGALRGGREVIVHQQAPTDRLAALPDDVVVPAMVPGLASTAPAANLGSVFSLSFGGPLAGLGLFVLAEVFARGVRLRDDVEGTV